MNEEFSLAPSREHRLELADGRELAVAEFGEPTGVPVVFFAGAASSRSMNAFGTSARERHVRMLTFDRPGLGDSTPHAAKSLTSVAADLADVLEQLELIQPYALANSQGAPFALAAAGQGMFRRTALVSPADEVAHEAVRSQLPADVASFVESVHTDPHGITSFLSAFDPDRMFEFVMSGASRSDAPVFGNERFRQLFRRSLEEALGSGGAGYAQDTVLASSRWPVAVPRDGSLDIWFGSDDTAHSPDLGATLSGRFGGERRIVDGVGGSLLWVRTGQILDQLMT
ncbi:alpha/beta fold hydrolase [Microbacterium timonense]|jgi:pimeloyl-ACP methyl ester carboxylesterase|uniref:alpha/beta fold hydrolase n=1 Tax=Microbacterium timonense TaxID=2086576 RepID=UPI000D0E792C|nr:alpha/beta hydrolase [Microbacterium timonense]